MEVEKALVQWKAELLQANEVIAYWEASLANRWICGMYLGWKPGKEAQVGMGSMSEKSERSFAGSGVKSFFDMFFQVWSLDPRLHSPKRHKMAGRCQSDTARCTFESCVFSGERTGCLD